MAAQPIKWKFTSGKIRDSLQSWGRHDWDNTSRTDVREYLLNNHRADMEGFAARYKGGVSVEQLVAEFVIDDLMSEIFFGYFDEVAKLEELKRHDERFANSADFYELLNEIEVFSARVRRVRENFMMGIPIEPKEEKKDD